MQSASLDRGYFLRCRPFQHFRVGPPRPSPLCDGWIQEQRAVLTTTRCKGSSACNLELPWPRMRVSAWH